MRIKQQQQQQLPEEVAEYLQKCLRDFHFDLKEVRADRRKVLDDLTKLDSEEIKLLIAIQNTKDVLKTYGVDLKEEDYSSVND